MVKTLRLSLEEANKIAESLNYRHEYNTVIAVVQDVETKEILMVGNMNKEAVIKTLTTGYLHLWSLSRNKLWKKGETSGNFQIVEDIKIDCDADAVIIKVKPLGPACHTGNYSCFYRGYNDFINSARM